MAEGWMQAPRSTWARRLLIGLVLRVVALFTLIDLGLPWVVEVTDVVVGACLLGLVIALRPAYRSLPPALDGIALSAGIAAAVSLLASDPVAALFPRSLILVLLAAAAAVTTGTWYMLAATAWWRSGRSQRSAALAVLGGGLTAVLGTTLTLGLAITLPVAVVALATGMLTMPFLVCLTQADAPVSAQAAG